MKKYANVTFHKSQHFYGTQVRNNIILRQNNYRLMNQHAFHEKFLENTLKLVKNK